MIAKHQRTIHLHSRWWTKIHSKKPSKISVLKKTLLFTIYLVLKFLRDEFLTYLQQWYQSTQHRSGFTKGETNLHVFIIPNVWRDQNDRWIYILDLINVLLLRFKEHNNTSRCLNKNTVWLLTYINFFTYITYHYYKSLQVGRRSPLDHPG